MISFPFHVWLTTHPIIGGDWRFFWPENLKQILLYSFAWDSTLNTGIGKSNISILWLNSYLGYGAHFLTNVLYIPWNISEKLLFFWPIVICSFISTYLLSRKFFKNILFNSIAGFLYLTNTYALMIFSGGQVGISLAYAVFPFVIVAFITTTDCVYSLKTTTREKIFFSIVYGCTLALQILFDPRIALLSFFVTSLFFILKEWENNLSLSSIGLRLFYIYGVPIFIISLLHSFWILPLLFSGINPVAEQFSSSEAGSGITRFFSFGLFENTFSILHPNWPENIFGKVYFMRPEFLLVPIIVYSALFFVKKEKNKRILLAYILLLGLLGAFFSKGTNPPFGALYEWLANNLPGFSMYRDPSKFYAITVLSYSILIPFTLLKASESVSNNYFKKSIVVSFIIYWLFLLGPLFAGQIKGTFKNTTVPASYDELREFLQKDPEFYRTLWVPQQQRFGYFSHNHPLISAQSFFDVSSPSGILTALSKPETNEFLKEASVRYVIVPFDSEGEIFLNDRKYDDSAYTLVVKKLNSMGQFTHVATYGKIQVYKTRENDEHFFTSSKGKVIYEMINPSKYFVSLENVKKGERLVFSESYSPQWKMIVNNTVISSRIYNNRLNSFVFPDDGSYTASILYQPQKWVDKGHVITLFSLISITFYIFLYLVTSSKNDCNIPRLNN